MNNIYFRKEDFMDEIHLINMLSFLAPEVLENDYIEDDLSSLNPTVKNVVLIIAGLATLAGVVGIIIKKNKKPVISLKKLKLPNSVLNLVTN